MLSKDIWSLIAEHLDCKDFYNFARISKITYYAYKQMNDKRERERRCMKCGGKTFKHDGLLKDKEGYTLASVWEECDEYCCINTHEFGKEVWYYCSNDTCDCAHLECSKCNVYCNLRNHNGVLIKHSKKIRLEAMRTRLIELDYGIQYEEMSSDNSNDGSDEEYIIENPKESNLKFIDRKKWCATGPNGGYCNAWECRKCGILEEYTDK